MLKMVGAGKRYGRPIKVIVLGLSRINIDRLGKGQPIEFSGEDVGLEDVEIVIFAGATEELMARQLADLIGPQTQTNMDPRTTN